MMTERLWWILAAACAPFVALAILMVFLLAQEAQDKQDEIRVRRIVMQMKAEGKI